MAPRTLLVTLLLSLTTLMFTACSDDDVSADTGTTPALDSGADAQTLDTGMADTGTTDAAPAGDQAVATHTATDLQLGLHDNSVKIVLSSMSVVGKEATEWDLYMSHGDPVDQLPHLELGPGVTAQNLGNTDGFHDVTTAPTEGYEADNPTAQTYVIGSTWRNGGDGTTGFLMTKNIYALKLADGTYAKIEVLSAQGGVVHVLAYHQPATGDTDLLTNP